MTTLPWIDVNHRQFQALISATNGTKMLIDTQRHNADAMARLWTAYQLCLSDENLSDKKPCGHCQSCHLLAVDTHPDSLFHTDACPIDRIRHILTQVHTTPTIAPVRAVYLGCIDQYNPHAINALLKTLEEPPPHSVFLLSATSRRAVNPTVLSRAQCLTLPKPSHAQSLQWLMSTHQLSEEEAQRRLHIHADNPFTALTNKTLPAIDANIEALIACLASPLEHPAYLMQLEQLPAESVLDYVQSQILLLIHYLQCDERPAAIDLQIWRDKLSAVNIIQLHTLYVKLSTLRRPDQQQINPLLAVKSMLLQSNKQRSLST